MEEWRPVKGYEDRYEVSSAGRVRSLKSNRGKYSILSARILNKTEYLAVSLYNKDAVGRKCKDKTIHRLVAEVFLPNPDNKPQVNHIDGYKTNNNVSNLEWTTASENQIHSRQVLGNLMGSKNGRSKFSPEQIQEIHRRGQTESGAAIARSLGVCKSCICRILRGITYQV